VTVNRLVDIANPFVVLALLCIDIVINYAGLADFSDYSENNIEIACVGFGGSRFGWREFTEKIAVWGLSHGDFR
jgi:hypothetical protein